MRALFTCVVICVAALQTTAAPTAQSGRSGRPNIIFIMTDDHAAHDRHLRIAHQQNAAPRSSCQRGRAPVERLCDQFDPCTPSRAAILTGQYSHINGVTMFNRFDSSRMTVARLLQQGGYHTGMIGKWHLGSDPVGFDSWEILPGQGVYNNPVFYTATGERTYTGRYVTDVITDLAVDFKRDRPREKPFFLMMHHKAPHRPWERVQSVAVRLIVEREEERKVFRKAAFWNLEATLSGENRVVTATLLRVDGKRVAVGKDFDAATGKPGNGTVRVLDGASSAALAETLRGSIPWEVTGVEEKPVTQHPAPPFTTSTLQQEANRKHGFSADRTMSAAQKLFDSGVISYHRTDSTTLSDKALQESGRTIRGMYGDSYYGGARRYRKKVKNESGRPCVRSLRTAGAMS